MKKFLVILLLLIPLIFTSCATTVKGAQLQLQVDDIEVLGRVTVETVAFNIFIINFDGRTISKLYKKAEKEYPGYDDIINIYIDTSDIGLFPFLDFYKTTISGLAIKYKNDGDNL